MGIAVQITPITLRSPINGTLVLNIGVSVSGSFQGLTYGLLGTYDGNMTNDLRVPNGTVVGVADNMTLQEIHHNFGQLWAINPLSTLFYYESGDSAAFYWVQNQNFTPSFVSPPMTAAQASQIQTTCGITSTNQTLWTVAENTCYFDAAVTNDTNLARISSATANEVLAIAVDQRSPPVFNSDLQLIMTVPPSTLVTINFTAVSPYTSVVLYTLISGPPNCTFDIQTAIFTWQAPAIPVNDTAVSVSAQDNLYNLTSTFETVIRVRIITTTTTTATATTTTSIGSACNCFSSILFCVGLVLATVSVF
jgi:fibulin 1/2